MTKKLGFWMIGLLSLAFFFTTCTKDDVQPITSSDDTELEFKANAETPFKATYETTFILPSPANPLLQIEGEGKGTHLGKSTLVSDSWFDGMGGQFGNIVFYAANGDELYAYFAGSANPNPPFTFFDGEFMLGYWADGPGGVDPYPKDGTGRFAGATGSGTYAGWANLAEGVGVIKFVGVMINP